MSYLAEGILGGFQGATSGVSFLAKEALEEKKEISKEQRRRLAEKLRMEMQAELQKAYQERGFSHTEKMAGERREFEEGQTEKRMEHEEGLLQTRLDAEKEGLLRVGPYDKVIKKGTGEEVTRGIGTSASTGVKTSDKIKAQSEVQNILQNLAKPKDKGGINWKQGDPIPDSTLNQINAMLRAAGENEIKQETVKKDPGIFTKLWDWAFGESEESVLKPETQPKQQITLPSNIKKVSEAIQYLMKTHNMTEGNAKQYLRSEYGASNR